MKVQVSLKYKKHFPRMLLPSFISNSPNRRYLQNIIENFLKIFANITQQFNVEVMHWMVKSFENNSKHLRLHQLKIIDSLVTNLLVFVD